MKIAIWLCTALVVAVTGGDAWAGYDRVTCDSGWTEVPDVGVCRRNDGQHLCPYGFEGYDLHVDNDIPNDGWGCFCQSGYTQITSTGMGTFENRCVVPPSTPDDTTCTRGWAQLYDVSTPTGMCEPDCSTGFWGVACDADVWWQTDYQVYVGAEALLYRDRVASKLYLFNAFGALPEPCGVEGFWWDVAGSGDCEGAWTAGLTPNIIPPPQNNKGWYQFKWQ